MKELNTSIFRITKILSPHSNIAPPTKVIKGKRLYFFYPSGEQVIYFLDEGTFLMKQSIDDKVISVILSPAIIGWSMVTLDGGELYLERVDYGKIRSIPFNTAMRIITAYERFDDVLTIVNTGFHALIDHCIGNHGDSLSIVHKMLRSLNQLPPDVKLRFSALSYISQRTSLSKSTIKRGLKQLQQQGLLTLERGKLHHLTEYN